MSKNIIIPKALSTDTQKIESLQSFVIVGANGSGKSHLGAWIEKKNGNVLRISAQRALTIPNTIKITNAESSWNKIYAGYEQSTNKLNKWGHDKHTYTLVDDYESVLSLVFSTESHELREFKNKCDEEGKVPTEYKTIVEKILTIWNSVLPQRGMVLDNFEAKAKSGEETYNAGAMSDGERVCLYLIAQCLIVPDGYIIVIDEPEIHLHTSIMKRLWDEIEKYCPNKTFVYITHNLKFATSRNAATKIWTQSYDGHDKWELAVLDNKDLPEELFLEILGTRSPILFVEGNNESFDLALYKEIYDGYHVIPCHNCQKVIELTRTFNNPMVKSLHMYDVKGVIDRDFLTNEEIEAYERQNIFAIDVSEVENLYLIEPLIKLIAKQIGQNEEDIFNQVKEALFNRMKSDKSLIINAFCEKELQYRLRQFSSRAISEEDFNADLHGYVASIDIHSIYAHVESLINEILVSQDYGSLIKVYNNKGLCGQVGSIIGLKVKYPQVVLNLLKGEKRNEILNALKQYLPKL